MTVVNSTSSNNLTGVCASGNGATAFVSSTAASKNGIAGLFESFGAVFNSAQNNPSTGNGSPTAGTITSGGLLF